MHGPGPRRTEAFGPVRRSGLDSVPRPHRNRAERSCRDGMYFAAIGIFNPLDSRIVAPVQYTAFRVGRLDSDGAEIGAFERGYGGPGRVRRGRRWPVPAGHGVAGRRNAGGGGRVAGQGEDGGPLSRRRLPGSGLLRPCAGPAGEGGLGEARRGLRHGLRDRAAGGAGTGIDPGGACRRRRPGSRHRSGPRGRGDCLAGADLAGRAGRRSAACRSSGWRSTR